VLLMSILSNSFKTTNTQHTLDLFLFPQIGGCFWDLFTAEIFEANYVLTFYESSKGLLRNVCNNLSLIATSLSHCMLTLQSPQSAVR
jgi:hypothetical protein